jgi:broad specificity phosphatase PhoE
MASLTGTTARPFRGAPFAEWRRGEDNAPLDPVSRPGSALVQLVRAASCVIASPLRRSLESARLLAPAGVPVTDALFREADLPCGFRSAARLRPDVWAVLARSAWFFGWADGMESFAATRVRAAGAAQLLTARAESHDTIAVVGHGMINIVIARELRAHGWRGPRVPSRRHWSFGLYRR